MKGIVDRADGNEPRAEMRRGEPERSEHQEEVVLRDAELDMLPRRMRRPFLRGRDLGSVEDVGTVPDAGTGRAG